MPLSWIVATTASVKKQVTVAGLTMAGTPASQLTATFSNMPHTGKLNALMCTATPRLGTRMWWPPNVPSLLSGTYSPSVANGVSGNRLLKLAFANKFPMPPSMSIQASTLVAPVAQLTA